MATLATCFRLLCDSLAGYLLVVALTSGFPLLAAKLAAARDNLPFPRAWSGPLRLHPTLPDLHEFYPVECLALYLASYPALAMYRSAAGGVTGCLTLAIGLLGVLGGAIGPAMIGMAEEKKKKKEMKKEDEKKEKSREIKGEGVEGSKETAGLANKGTTMTSRTASTLTADTSSEQAPPLEDEVLTPTYANTPSGISDKAFLAELESVTDNPPPPPPPQSQDAADAAAADAAAASRASFNPLHDDESSLSPGRAEKLDSRSVSISNLRSVLKKRHSKHDRTDEDALSAMTWDPAYITSTDATPVARLAECDKNGAEEELKEDLNKTTENASPPHRRKKSCSIQDSSLLKEMDGNLIDSNLEPHYSNLIDSANAPIFGVDAEGRVNVWNKCAMRIVGYTPDEVMGKNLVKEFITKDYQASVGRVIDQALRGDETANYEFPLMTKEGVRIEILLNATARRNPDGKIIGVVGIGQDITGRIAQEREYTRLIDTANAPIFGVDTQCAVNIWNQSAIQLVGYSTEEVMGKNLVKEFITDEFKTAVQTVLDQALHGEETANFEFPLLTKAGVRLEVLLNATTRRDEQGNIIGVVGIGQDITGRLAQEREYTRLIDTANAPIFGVDTLGCVNVWNKCAMGLIGYSTEEVMGRSLVQEFITDDFKTAVQAVLDQALAGDETDNFEFPLITKGGARIEVLLNATTRRDEQGNVIGVVGIGQDITARLAQEREYSKLIDTANAPIFGVDNMGAVNVWNKNAHKLVGYAPEEVMGKNLVKEFITDEFKTAVQAVLDQALHGGETANFEFPLMTKAGVRLDVLLNATTRRDDQGNIIGMVGIGQDITGRLAQEREYTRLIDTANAPIFGVDTQGRVNVWNKCAMRLIGYSTEEVMGRSLVQEFITDDFKTAVQAVLDQALAGDETDNFEFPLITKGRTRIEVLLNATTRRDEQGNVIGVVGIGQDITARLAQEREYSKLIDTANAPIFGVDNQGKVNVWNKNAHKLVGYAPEEVMGKILVKEFITDEFKTAVQAVLDQALHGEETANFEFPLMTKGGVRLDVLLNATTRRDEQGNIIGVVGIGQDITGRLAQEREYTRLIDTANAPIFGVDTLGRVNVWNKCAMRLIGYSTDEVMGHSLVQEFITNDYQASVQAVLDQALQGSETDNFEFPLITKAGAHIEVLLNATTRRDEQGNIIGVVGIGQDITARLAQEREYSKLIDTANAPIFGVDTQGRVNVWNQCAMRLVGYTINEVMGKNLVQGFITKEYRAAVSSVLDKALLGKETANFEFPLITKNGIRIEVLLNATTRRDEQGNVIGVVGIGQDITARLAQEREYSKLIDTANAPIFGVDTQGRVNVWNICARKLVGYSTAEVMGHSLVQEFITKDYQASVQAVLDQALAGVETANFEFPLITKAGARIEVLLNATTRRNEHGKVIGVVGIGQDITARLAQEREYSKLIDNANAPIFGVDTLGRVNVWNKCARKIVGYTLDEVMGQNLVGEFITKEYKEAVSTVLTKALKGEETANFEFPLITKHGVRIEVLLNATTRRDEQGTVIGVVGIGQDITGRIAQEREYSKLIDSANAPIFGVDTMGCVNVWNICARKLVGYSTEEVMGHSLVQEFITNDYQASVQAVLDRALDGVETANFEFPLITKAGTRIEVLLNATTRRNEHGKVIGVVGIGQDITGRIAQEREYAKLIDTANAPIFGVDTEGKVNVWNKCARKLVGYTPDEVMGKNLVREFITDEFKTAVQAVLDQALHGEETANFEFPLMTKAGVRLEVLLNATTRKDEQGNVIGVVGIGQDITARLAQEREYSKLIDTANAPIFGVDTLGRVTIWNKNAHKLVGYTSDEVMGQNLVEQFITPEHRARVQSVIDEALAGEETANFEFPLMTKAGVRLEVLLNATTRRDEQGDVIGVVGIGQDITGRLAQEREYTRLIDTANAPIFGVDTHGRVNVWNKCAMKLTGYPSEEVMGHSLVKEFIRNEHQEKVQDVIDQTLHGEETANFDFPLMTKGGVRLEILLNATTRRNEHGHIIGMVGIGQDITERIAQEREFAKLIDSANAPIFGVDIEGKVNVWNQCVSSLTGFSTLDVYGRKLVDEFVSFDFKDSVSDILKNALLGIETANFEFPLLTSGDHVVEVLLNATTRRDAQDNVIGVVGIGQDITDARAKRDAEMKQRAAEAATAAQATISAHVYHEIRNVVGSVLALADRATEAVDLALIEEDDEVGLRELPTRVRELTDHQRLVCQHAVDTLNDMLDVAKMENGTYTPKHEVIDLGEICRKAAALQSPRMRPKVNLELNVPAPDSTFVISDSVLLLQYLSNLLSNAAKFTAAGSVVLVCMVREAGPDWLEVTLGVADSGPGIARDSQRHVLRAFTTGDALPQEDRIGGTKSTGIGLRLADLIAHTLTQPSLKPRQDGKLGTVTMLEGGTLCDSNLPLLGVASDAGLRIESPLEKSHDHFVPNGGPGTFIYFQSAIQRASADAITRHRDNPSGGAFHEIDFGAYVYDVQFAGTMKVLAIDDQRTMRQMVAMIYQKIAFEYPGVVIDCYTALSGEQAIRMCREHRFHIITMDQQMSIDYCQSLVDEMSTMERPDGPIPEFVRFGSDKIVNAKKRQAYFKNDKWIQDIQPGDGTLLGHEAIGKIRQENQEQNRPPILIFNLTGNLLEADRLMFLEVGSSGMLPKPTKLEDYLGLIKKNMGLYISQGLLQLSDNMVVMDDNTFQIGTRHLRDDIEPEPVTTERGKLTVPWAGGATQRSAGPGGAPTALGNA